MPGIPNITEGCGNCAPFDAPFHELSSAGIRLIATVNLSIATKSILKPIAASQPSFPIAIRLPNLRVSMLIISNVNARGCR